MISDAILQTFSFIPPLIVGLVSLLIIRHQGIDRKLTISVHAAQKPLTSLILALTILICGTLYYLVIWLWIGPRYHIPFLNILMIIAFLGMFTLALMPADSRRQLSARLHSSAGILLLGEMYIMAWLVVISPYVTNIWVNVISWVFLGFATLLPIAMLTFHRLRQEALIMEVAFVGLFYVLVIALTYT